ncbi:MAG: ParB N-terminal domain-containing protein [Kiritimatiellae bacterium]|jgi:hypothetical protein|nr:ParB N-terminal domain-containing protein [Kiritimatiellia bacterium]
MSRTYKITGFNWLDRTQLKPHADAQLPMAPDDQMALERSIEEGGLIQPLLVLDKPDKLDGLFEVVDGCNRLDKSTDGKLPCVLIQCDNVREVALTCLGTGRKRSTGQRIMAYLEMHKREVVKAAELGAQKAAGNPSAVSRDTAQISGVFANFTSDAIAATLSVSKKDVLLAIDLLMCLEKKCTVPQRVGSLVTPTRELDLKDKADKVYFDCLKLTHANVMAGSTPIRRWKAAQAGKSTQAEGRTEIDYADLFREGLNHLRTASKHWKDITFQDRGALVELAAKVGEILPGDVKRVL